MILVSDSGPYRTRDNAGLFQKGAFHRLGRLEFFETDYQGSYGRKLYTRTNQVKRDCLRKMSVATLEPSGDRFAKVKDKLNLAFVYGEAHP